MEVKEGPCIVIALLVLPFDNFKDVWIRTQIATQQLGARCSRKLHFYTFQNISIGIKCRMIDISKK
jgi:hypothetical protein